MEFINLKKQYITFQKEINEKIQKVLDEAQFIGGEEIQQFEEKLAEYIGRKYCISCGNGTDALELAFMALGVGDGDAVFCPDMTFIASIESACTLGATPIFCDIEKRTFNLSPSDLENKIVQVSKAGKLTPKVVVMVDFLGNPADIEVIQKICEKYNLLLIEDAAQAIGAVYNGQKCGSFGDISTTSFFPSKPLGCYGDGGAVFTDNQEIAECIKSLKVHGKGKSKYDNIRIGMNSRLDTIQAAVLQVKLKYLNNEIEIRQEKAEKYNKELMNYVDIPQITINSVSSYAQYVLLLKDVKNRNKLQNYLNERNIPSLVYYPKTLHSMKAFEKYKIEDNYPNSTVYSQCNVGIPFSAYITEMEQNKVIKSIIECITDGI